MAQIVTVDFRPAPAPAAAPAAPAFQYAAFRAEFRRLKRLSAYARIHEHAARAARAREPMPREDGVPRWAVAARRERWYDDGGSLHAAPSPLRTLTRGGVFASAQSLPCEREAVAALEYEADLWVESHGRIVLTDLEYQAVMAARDYLTAFQNRAPLPGRNQSVAAAFARAHAGWIQSLGPGVSLDAGHVEAFVAYRLALTKLQARAALESADRVVALRAELGYEALFVRAPQRRPEPAHAPAAAPKAA